MIHNHYVPTVLAFTDSIQQLISMLQARGNICGVPKWSLN